MYKLNFSNPIVKKFREFYWETARQAVHAENSKKVKVKC